MVEFGLKLSDNKVEDWAHAYISYETLKNLIAAAKKAEKTREDLESQNEELAAEIKLQLANNDESSATEKIDSDLSLVGDEHSESQSLFSFTSAINRYGGLDASVVDSLNSSNHGSMSDSSTKPALLKRSGSDASLSSIMNFGGTVLKKKVSGYLQRHTYRYKLKKAIEDEHLTIQNFNIFLHEEAEKVNELYYRMLDEMLERFEYLEDTVQNSEFFREKHYTGRKLTKHWYDSFKLLSRGSDKMSVVSGSLIDITNDMEGVDDSDDDMVLLTKSEREDKKLKAFQAIKESDSVQRAMTDLHRRTKLLNNFAIMNSTGFIKIIKKFDKTFPARKGMFKHMKSDGYICGDGKGVSELSDKMEKQFAKWFCDGNITEARSVLLPKKGDGLDMDWSQLRLGYRLGMCSILALWVAWDCVWGLVKNGQSTIGGRTAFPVFRACGGLLLVHWFWGVSVYVWNRFRINYIFLFDFDPRIVQTPVMIFEDTTDETLVFLVLMLLYYKAGSHSIPDIIPPGCYPLILVLFTLKRLIFPLKVRIPLWKAIFGVITAPFTKPTFFHTYIGDIFTSMVKVFQDILWTGCFFLSGDFLISERDGVTNMKEKHWSTTIWYKNVLIPLICLFPLWIRFNQCLRRYIDTRKRNPNLLNAAKYALSQMVTLFGAFHPLYLMQVERTVHDETFVERAETSTGIFELFWFGLFIASSLYSYFWDVRMDWGLGRLKNNLLGTRLMFPEMKAYYTVMVADLFLRFMWVTTLIPPQSGARFEIPQYLSLGTMSMELFRRTIWGFFRLEHEHRSNSQGFRRVDFVPLHFSTESPNKATKIEHDGWQVLSEVIFVTIVVVSISAWSVISAQKATNNLALSHDNAHDL